MRARLEGNAQQDNGRFRDIQTTITRQDGYLESVWTMQAIAGPVVTGMTLFSSTGPDPSHTVSRITFQADVFQINTATGNTKQVFSTSADAIKLGDVLTVDLVNAKVFMGTGTFGNANTPFYVDGLGRLSATDKFKWDGVTFTVAGWELSATTISKNNAVLDSAGQLVLGTANDIVYISASDATYRLWVGNATAGSATFSVTKAGAILSTSGNIAGWTLSTTTISRNNATLDSAGQLILGTANDIIYISATDATYRIWAGNVTAGSASFSVTKAGVLYATGATISGTITATSGTIGGFTIGATELTGGTGIETLSIYSNGGGIALGNITGTRAIIYADVPNSLVGFALFNSANTLVGDFYVDTTFGVNAGAIDLYNSAGTATVQFNAAGTGAISTGLFIGSGSSLTSLNASNISSGTIANARLPSAISVTSLAGDGSSITNLNASNLASGTVPIARFSFTKVPTADVAIDGHVVVGGVKLATVA